MQKFKEYLTAEFKKKIIKKARQLHAEAEKKKLEDEEKRKQE